MESDTVLCQIASPTV